jgi:2-polyprenyl-6-hydroxyphenyl methylase/3-demethylubiquinone-9 3-methyltransferase
MKKRDIVLAQFPEHIAVRNAQSNSEFLSRAGFENIEVSFIPHYNIVRLVHPLSWLPVVGRYFRARLFITAQKPI